MGRRFEAGALSVRFWYPFYSTHFIFGATGGPHRVLWPWRCLEKKKIPPITTSLKSEVYFGEITTSFYHAIIYPKYIQRALLTLIIIPAHASPCR